MIKLSNSKFIQIFTKLLMLLVIAKAISLFIWWYLPSKSIELNTKENYQPKYQRADFKNMITKITTQQIKNKEIANNNSDNGISITNMILKGLYGSKTKGFVVVAMKSKPNKTSIVGIGESYQGYTLKSIFLRSAMFYKNGTDFILNLQIVKESSTIVKKEKNVSEKVFNNISKKDIKFYAKHPDKIWKDISIDEVRDDNELKGFKIKWINPKSKFAILGLQKNDLIIKANNIRLKSYKDALQIYQDLDNIDVMQIVILRNNKQMELVYEID